MADSNLMALPVWSDPIDGYVWIYLTDETDDYRASGETLIATNTSIRTISDSTRDIGSCQMVFNSASDLNVTFTGTPINGMTIYGYAVLASGGTGHKLLLPTGVYWGSTGTNRAALLNTADEYIFAKCADIGGTFRFLIYGSNGVTFAAS